MTKSATKKVCGVVMPISECDGCSRTHWDEVFEIITSVAEEKGFEARIVSDTEESNLIHKEILSNVYNNDIIICDISGHNPNVFFELGIRMATQKPTIIVKDDKTICPFDIGANKYIPYPRDLRYPVMKKFKSQLSDSISTTIKQSPGSSFIGTLGPFTVPDVENSKIPAADAILGQLRDIEMKVSSLVSMESESRHRSRIDEKKIVISRDEDSATIHFTGYTGPQLKISLVGLFRDIPEVESRIDYKFIGHGNNQMVYLKSNDKTLTIDKLINMIVSKVKDDHT